LSFLWTPVSVNYFNAYHAYGLNDSSQVVGEQGSGAFRWSTPSGVQVLADAPGVHPEVAWAISATGAIVGYGTTPTSLRRGFLHTDASGAIDLNSLVNAPTLQITEGRDIDATGRVVAIATDSTSFSHAVLLTPRPVQPVLFVRSTAPAGGNGLSWNTAYRSLQDALTAASLSNGVVQEIWVAAGTYIPTRRTVFNSSRSVTFQVLRNVTVFGGFAGNETSLAQRNWVTNETVLSGDLAGNDGPNFTNNAENAIHVVTATLPDLTVGGLDGFVISGGNADGTGSGNSGGGLRSEQGSAVIRNCTFRANTANFEGGGATAVGGRTRFEACTFNGNRCFGGGGGLRAGFRCVVDACAFTGNFLVSASGSGGAIDATDFTLIRGTVLTGNSAGGAPGGAVALDGASLMLNCTLIGNTTSGPGGGVQTGQTTTIVNCVFNGNQASMGGAISNVGTAINCTFVQNIATQSGGGLYVGSQPGTIVNCIAWANADGGIPGETAQIGGPGVPNISYSRVQSWTGIMGGVGNSGADPAFVDIDGPDNNPGNADDNLHLLRPLSSCIDAGNNTFLPADSTDIDNDGDVIEPLPLDLDRNPRTRDDPAVVNSGIGPGPIVDIGAYEVQPPTCYANCDNSSLPPMLNVNDFLCFQNRYAQGDSYANCDASTIPPVLNVNDFLCFLNAYAQGCP
jgi:probable HAF family extracellular repeat protein